MENEKVTIETKNVVVRYSCK